MHRTTFVWGLKRSGIHLVTHWLYSNLGADAREPLDTAALHEQLRDVHQDARAGVACFNNCGGFASRRFELGTLQPADFERAAAGRSHTIFGIEDCRLDLASRTAPVGEAVNLLVVRDPLNNLASRLKAAESAPDQFPVGPGYVDVLSSYCAELLGRTDHLRPKVVISYNRFVLDRAYRDASAAALGVPNLDVITEVPEFGGGSSFTGTERLVDPEELLTRFRQQQIPVGSLDLLLEREAVRSACADVFGYDLAEVVGELRR